MPDYNDAILPQLLSRQNTPLAEVEGLVLPDHTGHSLCNIPGTVSKLLGGPELSTPALSAEILEKFDGRYRNVIVLLVDALVDSRWTFTIAAWLLRSHGSGEPWPLALSYAGHEE